jgi:hypothetical protein
LESSIVPLIYSDQNLGRSINLRSRQPKPSKEVQTSATAPTPPLLYSSYQSNPRQRALVQPPAFRKRGTGPNFARDELNRDQLPDQPKRGRVKRVKQAARTKGKKSETIEGAEAQQSRKEMLSTPTENTAQNFSKLTKNTVYKNQAANDVPIKDIRLIDRLPVHMAGGPAPVPLTNNTAPFQPRRRPKIILDLGPEPIYDALN